VERQPGKSQKLLVSIHLSNVPDDTDLTTAQYGYGRMRRRHESRCPSQTWSPTLVIAGTGEGGYFRAVVVAFALRFSLIVARAHANSHRG
jgi:hypothetical protein